jgi:uncharacterized ferritin-like protein (DUF455 family)
MTLAAAEGGASEVPSDLGRAARAVVMAVEPVRKVELALAAARLWREGRLDRGTRSGREPMPARPGRPARPVLLHPRDMPRRSTGGEQGRFALVHALAHIELNAVDMTWDLIGRFIDEAMPRAFYDDWVSVGADEARHHRMVSGRLAEMGGAYGDLPAHDGLWQAAEATGDSLLARVAVVPLVLEARGLDVSPAMIGKLEEAGDEASAAVVRVIYEEEKRHVAFGAKWFRWLCARDGLVPEPTFHTLVRRHFRGPVKPPFNDRARAEAGLTPGFYKPLAALGTPAR